MLVQELYARLGMDVDQNSFRQARNQLSQFQKMTSFEKFGKGLKKKAVSFAKWGAVGIGAAFVGSVKNVLAFDDALSELQVSSDYAIKDMDAFRQEVLNVSRETGVAKEEVLDITRTFVALTGDANAGRQAMESFARIAVASGAATNDVATAAAALQLQLNIQPDEMERAFSVLSESGKRGQVELKDFANLFATTGANFKQFGNSQSLRGLTSVASGLQFVAQNFGGPAEAATGFNQLMQQIPKRFKELKAEGIDIFDESGKNLRDFSSIIFEIADLDLNEAELTKLMGGRSEAKLALKALIDNRDAWFDQARAIEQANNIGKDYDARQSTSSAKMKKAWNSLKVSIAEALTPERVALFAEAIVAAIKYAEKAVKVISDIAGEISDLINTVSDSWLGDAFGFSKDAAGWAIDNAGGFIPGGDIFRNAKRLIDGPERSNVSLFDRVQGLQQGREALLAPPSSNTSNANVNAPITINVTPGPGMDEMSLTAKVGKKVNDALANVMRQAAVSQGVD